MAAVDWHTPDRASTEQFFALASGTHPTELAGPNGEPLRGLHGGDAAGRLLGGNLTLIARLVGTPYLPDMTGAILFIEEIGESPYRVDGLLAQLRLSGMLDGLAGVVIGGFTGAEPKEGRPSLKMDQVFEDYFGALGIPVADGLLYGHFPVKSSIPVGIRARLQVDGDQANLSLLEQVVNV